MDARFDKAAFSEDEFPPEAALEQLRAHDRRMRDLRDDLALHKAMFTTDFWKHVAQTGNDALKDLSKVAIEVNRLQGMVGAYLAALYPKANRVVLGADVLGRGVPEKGQLLVNHWLPKQGIHGRILTALREANLYTCAGGKIVLLPGHASPMDRVALRIVPPWELVLDQDVGDPEEERFRGHAYYAPKRQIEKRYKLENLTGCPRKDFLAGTGATDGDDAPKEQKASSDRNAFVRVYEVYNLVDTWEEEGLRLQGRMEVYVLGQGDGSKVPVWVGPMPFARADGTPLPSVVPLIFNSEPEYPLRGVPPVKRVIPQVRELNTLRTFVALSVRKDARMYLYRKEMGESISKVTEGVDGAMIPAPEVWDKPLSDLIHRIDGGPISTNITAWQAMVEGDMERTIGASPNARGIITKATAQEVATTQLYTESEFGLHAATKDAWLTELVRLTLRAFLTAMQTVSDAAGSYEGQRVDVGATSAEPTEEGGNEAGAVATEAAGSSAAMVADEPAPVVQAKESTLTIKQDVLRIVSEERVLEVTVADLDGDFDITFVEGARTPMTEAASQQNLVALLPHYFELWGRAQKGDVLAEAYMQAIAEKFQMPRDLWPSALKAKAEKAAPKGEEKAPAPSIPPEMVERIAALPPGQALQVLRTALEGNPDAVAIIEKAMGAPPEVQAKVVATLLGAPPPVNGTPTQDPMAMGMEA